LSCDISGQFAEVEWRLLCDISGLFANVEWRLSCDISGLLALVDGVGKEGLFANVEWRLSYNISGLFANVEWRLSCDISALFALVDGVGKEGLFADGRPHQLLYRRHAGEMILTVSSHWCYLPLWQLPSLWKMYYVKFSHIEIWLHAMWFIILIFNL